MQKSPKLFLMGMVSGLSLPEGVNELFLEKARVFRNAAAVKEQGGPLELGANTSIYSGEGKERHLAGNVATYLIELESNAPGGQVGHTTIQGSGGVMIGISPNSEGITLSTGTKPHSAVRVAVPLGEAWDTPSLILNQFHRAVLPLRLLTKARILVFPVGVLASESMQEMLKSGLNKACPELLGAGLTVQLSEDDCRIIEAFCKKLARVNPAKFEVPIFLFSRSFYKVDVADRALDLIVALESLLSEGPDSIAYKIAFRASCLTAKDGKDSWSRFLFAKKAYKYRNDIVHGNKKTLKNARAELGQSIEGIEDLTRKCLTMACLLEVERPKLPIGNNVDMTKLESIDEYILTYCLGKKGTTPLDSFPEIGKLWQSIRVL